MEMPIVLLLCNECSQVFYEEIGKCKKLSNGAYSVEWRKLRHHGNTLSLMGFATAVR